MDEGREGGCHYGDRRGCGRERMGWRVGGMGGREEEGCYRGDTERKHNPVQYKGAMLFFLRLVLYLCYGEWEGEGRR